MINNIPEFLYHLLIEQYGKNLTNTIIEGYSQKRPLTLRANTLKTSIENIKTVFDDIYWKCPNIINQIKINFRCLYFKFRKKFDVYFTNSFLDLNILNRQNYYDNYRQHLHKYEDLKSRDIKFIQNNFLLGIYDIKEYDNNKLEKLKKSLVNDLDKFNLNNLQQLSYTLFEYSEYLNFKYIIEYVREVYNEKNNFKKSTKKVLKSIDKIHNKINKINRKVRFVKFFKGENVDLSKYNLLIDNFAIELDNLYKNLDVCLFNERIFNTINNNSTILDVLQFVFSYKLDLLKIIKKNKTDISSDDILKEYDSLEKLITYPDINIINNLSFLDDKDIVMIIIDKYKLMNINLDRKNFENSELENLISEVNKILVSEYVCENNIKLQDIKFMIESKNIIDNNFK